MSVIATSTGIDNDEELNLNTRVWDDIRKKGFEHLEEEGDFDDESESDDHYGEESEYESDEDDYDFEKDDKALIIEKMANDMERNI